MDETQITVALFGALAVVLAASIPAAFKFIGTILERRRLERTETQEREWQKFASDNTSYLSIQFTDFVHEWDGIYKELNQLIDETCIDRFLILRAINGKRKPETTTAVFQFRARPQVDVDYVYFGLDHDYVRRLNQLEDDGCILFSTDEIVESAIKRVYTAEGVKHSLWCPIEFVDLGHGKRAITYCSFSTHDDERIDERTRLFCQKLASRLRGVAHIFAPLNGHKEGG